ncbi:hypothetical protein HanRHA438_Chr00c18g0851751 [Helianthus annuus]|uniref:Uncharacterized protein n=1 Tax=Helianthus annuus TaxID=4232 RepID=A0A251RSQ2_HELAN|nr:hypothetical protein HanXRQr2_Chr17g0824511 [Helianthus annuus]KAJ0449093.1 hypothetical protein HanHA89_Chr17g0724511 [Helianthus annuus]KAJ0637763.1 hypothetical protein HanOQP8_Chr17g0677611 [Helianthus annuus]KAJ0828190.1 hypothetical protein HanRHA438_Chr17g0834431 [Helianthus annuus]KAJ0954372.1 hypothetical protein HanRHA438_Chr00c18g0851751 [Helianthus annuus]
MCITWYKRGMQLRGVEGVSLEAIRRPDYRLRHRSVVERERVREGKRVEVLRMKMNDKECADGF